MMVLDPVAVARFERESGITITPEERDTIMTNADAGLHVTIISRGKNCYIAAIPLVRFPHDLVSADFEEQNPFDLLFDQ